MPYRHNNWKTIVQNAQQAEITTQHGRNPKRRNVARRRQEGLIAMAKATNQFRIANERSRRGALSVWPSQLTLHS